MALRITHTNNSSGHDGTYVYRSTSPMDPQNLPAPIADETPVALGETFEYIDNVTEAGDYYYRTQDHEGAQVSAVSDEMLITIAEDYAGAQIGDEIGGGVYAGKITYPDNRQFHIIAGKADSEVYGLRWGAWGTSTGIRDEYDGVANQQNMLQNFSGTNEEAFIYARDYLGGGFGDWYVPAKYELEFLYDNLSSHPEFSEVVASGDKIWSSTENSSGTSWYRYFDRTVGLATYQKGYSDIRTRPIRRVSV